MSGSRKISELTSATVFTGDELMVVVQDGETRQANVRKLDVFQIVQSVNGLTGNVILGISDIGGVEQLVADQGVSAAIAAVSVRVDDVSTAITSTNAAITSVATVLTSAVASVSVRVDDVSAAITSVQAYLLAELSAVSGGGITDAPNDGLAYVRQSASWQTIPRRPTLVTVSTSVYSPVSAVDGQWYLLTNSAGCSITIPTSASVGFPLFTMLTFEQDGAASGIFRGATGVSIRPAPSTSAETGGQGSVVQLFKRTSVFWTIYGTLKRS